MPSHAPGSRRLVFLSFGFACALALTACGDDASGTTGGGGSGAGTGTAGNGSGGGGAGGMGAGGMGADPTWGCVGSVEWPAPTSTEAHLEVHVSILTDLMNSVVLDGGTIMVCSVDDPTCAGTTYPLTGGSGSYAGVVPLADAPFEGFLRIQHPTAPDLQFRLTPPLSDDRTFDFVVDSDTSLSQLAEEAGVTLDPARGTVWFNVRDCGWSLQTGNGAAAEVRVGLDTADASTVIAYLDADGVHIEPMLDATSASGLAVAFNVPVGTATAEGHRVSDGALVSRIAVPVHADAESAMWLAPTPDLP